MLRIDIRSMKPGVHERKLEPTALDLDVDPEEFSDIHVDVRMDYSGTRMLVSVNVSAQAVLRCDRTLALFTKHIDGFYGVLFMPPESIEPDTDEDDIRPLHATDEEIDLTDIVRDTLLLAVPVRKIAPGAEDAEIPTVFGEPEEAEPDPRWIELQKLRDQGAGSEQ